MLRQSIESDAGYLTELRHDLHSHPELMYEEHQTSERVQAELSKTSVEFVAGLAGGTGVLGWLPATRPGGGTVALRADMDALPIHEETGLPYASQVAGKMHACGHDGHTANLVGAARALSRVEDRPNNVLFVFQPAEEGGAGGLRLCEEGAMAGRIIGSAPDVIYGLHGWPDQDEGTVYWKVGPMLAATDEFVLTVRGRGGHAAAPHLTADPVVASAHVVTALQTVASRNVSPLDSIVFTTAAIQGGSAHNVIPDEVVLRGTMRTLLPETRVLGKRRFYEIAEGTAAALGCSAGILWKEGYPVTENDARATARFRAIAVQTLGEGRVRELAQPVMGGEDFSYYGAHVPASFFFVGMRRVGDTSPAMLHTSRLDFNDAVIPDCVELFCNLAMEPVQTGATVGEAVTV